MPKSPEALEAQFEYALMQPIGSDDPDRLAFRALRNQERYPSLSETEREELATLQERYPSLSEKQKEKQADSKN